MELKHMLSKLRADIFVKRNTTDGGPGSGNWGHAGRPGKVGGSAKGNSGKQYRGGRSDIGYFNSRKDWLNGLSGEKQQKASRMLKAAEKENAEAGEKFSPEELIMKTYPRSEKKEFLDLVGESRSWSDRARQLQDENLTEDEKKYLWGLTVDYHYDHPGEDEDSLTQEEFVHGNLDRVFDNLLPEEKQFYLDMKAKACGMPTSGKKIEEYSDEFQRAIGAKKTTEEKNAGWLYEDGISEAQREKVLAKIKELGANFYGETKPDLNDVERNLETNIIKNLAEHNKGIIDEVRNYTRAKEMCTGVNAASILYRGDSDSLNEEQRKFAKDVLETFSDGLPSDEAYADLAEQRFFDNDTVTTMAKAYYLGLKLRALGLTDRKPEDDILEQAWGDTVRNDYWPDNKSVIKRVNAKKEQEEQYHITKSQNKVVVSGDSMSEGVDKLRKADGKYTEDDLKKIGDVIYPEFEKLFTEKKTHEAHANELYKKYSELIKEQAGLHREYNESEEEFEKRKEEHSKAVAKAWDEYYSSKSDMETMNITSELLKRVRKTGWTDKKSMKEHFEGRSTVKESIINAYQLYPTEWIEMSLKNGKVFTKKVNRGYYSDGGSEIAISGDWDDSKLRCAIHELGHRFEFVVPGIRDAEREFYERRTRGEEPVQLRVLTGNKRYDADEVSKKDDFVDPYIGKYYGESGFNGFEVVSMGFQYAFNSPENLMKDKDYARLIFGLLAVG